MQQNYLKIFGATEPNASFPRMFQNIQEKATSASSQLLPTKTKNHTLSNMKLLQRAIR
ncbi:MAG: hypothetical protein GAK29_04456 [Acinetobacter bereziniae]|uniref:Uncharacterized protein n=1 Tax=Acinetobacter bereziniae TaxID=106648 RepID=A0A833PBL3_ACIBZ|nr:MAG: hypothetical protein GAK29_04456 [Acinetobacter bereziniae]